MTVSTVAADVGDEGAMTNAMARFGSEWPPLGGVVHAAVAPTAAPLAEMPLGMFETMFRTKVSSYRLIERLSADQPLTFFVDFSTTTALLGSSELAHYAAANAVLDALACRRRAAGETALSVNWGVWDKVNVDARERERITRGGLRPMATAVGLAALEFLLAAGATRAIVADVDWQVLPGAYESRRPQPILSRLAAADLAAPSGVSRGADRAQVDLILLEPDERRAMLEQMVRRDVADVVGLQAPQSIDAGLSLFKMGLDLLMAIQLQRRLERTVGETLAAALAFNYPTVEALVELLDSRIAARVPVADPIDNAIDLLSRVDELSGAEIDSLIESDAVRGGRVVTVSVSAEDQKRELLRRLLRERTAKQPDPKVQKPLAMPTGAETEPSLKPAPRDGELELSHGQEMVWLLEQIIPEAMFYNIVERFGIKGPLVTDLLRRCIDEVIKRHEALRTIYPMVAGQPVQRIKPPTSCDLRVFDLRRIPAAGRDQEARRLIVADVKTRFDIAVGPVLRPSLLQLGDEDYILAVVVHHIAIDGWSLRLFMHEVAAFYGAFSEGRTPELPPISIQYADFAYWERRWLTGDRLDKLRDYWRKTLGEHPPALNLPTDYSPRASRTFDSATHEATIPVNVIEGLREIGRREGATFFTVLLAGFATLLMRYTGREDFVIGSVITSRPRPEVENLLGFFINSLALRTDLTGNPTFSELVVRTREIVFAAHEHGAYPFQRLVEVLQPKRSVNSNPFAQIFLNMLNLWDREEVSLPNLSIRPLGGLALHMPVDLFTLFARVSERQLGLTFVYSTELFKPETIERMATDLHSLLEAAAVAPHSRIWDLPISAKHAEAPSDAVGDILAELGTLGVRLSVEDGRLKVNAPKGALNDNLKAGIASHREDIITRLRTDGSHGPEARKLRHIARTPPLPLTAVQKRFWFLDKIGQGRSVPNVMFPLRFEGPIDFDAMMAAVTAILARHETLLMRIGDRDGEPYPEITAVPGELVTIADLTALPDESRESAGDKLSKQFMQDEFNLVTGPLAKVLFVRLSPTATLLTLSMHHIVADGWSSSIILRELGAVYSALSNGRAPDLPPLAHQYVDYAAWEAAQVRDGLFERQVGYWREKLAGAPPLLGLPTDRPRPAQRSFQGSRVDCVIAEDVVARLLQFSKRHDATLFMTVLAAFAVVLHRLTAQDEIVIGTPAANRGNPDLEQIVGPFVNSLSLRLNISGNPSFASYLSQVRRATIEAIDNRDVPFDMIVEAINPARTLDHAPIYQVMFGLHNFPVQPPRFEGLGCSFVSPDTRVARLDLQLDMAVHESQLFGAYEYASDLFDHVTIERLHEQLVEVLKGILEDEGRSVRDLPMRSPRHDRILLDVWNDTRLYHDRGLCAHQLFERAAARNPESAALIVGAETYNYLRHRPAREPARPSAGVARGASRRQGGHMCRPHGRNAVRHRGRAEGGGRLCAAGSRASAGPPTLHRRGCADRLPRNHVLARGAFRRGRCSHGVSRRGGTGTRGPRTIRADVPSRARRRGLRHLHLGFDRAPQGRSGGTPQCRQLSRCHAARAGAGVFGRSSRRHDAFVRHRGTRDLVAAERRRESRACLQGRCPRRRQTHRSHRAASRDGDAGDAFDLASPARSRMERQVRPEGAVWRRSHAGRPRGGRCSPELRNSGTCTDRRKRRSGPPRAGSRTRLACRRSASRSRIRGSMCSSRRARWLRSAASANWRSAARASRADIGTARSLPPRNS